MSYSLALPYAHGGPLGSAIFRQELSDFIVREELGFTPEGEGEHHYLHLRKAGINTEWLAKSIGRLAGVKANDVGFCGLKDRHGITSQWFSVYLPKGKAPDWNALAEGQSVEILQITAGKKKLRRGQHQFNSFDITLRDLNGVDTDRLEAKLKQVAQVGVPNYFGEQRFGRDGNNLVLAAQWLEQKVPLSRLGNKGMIMSSARSHIFNCVLAERVRKGSWNCLLAGDSADSPTGPLWGRGRSLVQDETLALETEVLQSWGQWLDGLEHCGLNQERRSLILLPQNFRWQHSEGALTLSFDLPPGEFATVLLRELFDLNNQKT